MNSLPVPPCMGDYWECTPVDYIIGDVVVSLALIGIAFAVVYLWRHRDGRF